MEPWGTPTLAGCSYENFPSRNSKTSITKKRWNKAKYLTWNSKRLKFVKKTACQTLLKDLDISNVKDRVGPDLWKGLTILSDTTVKRSAVDREDLKPYWSQKKGLIF